MTVIVDFQNNDVVKELLELVPEQVGHDAIVFAGGSLVEGFGNATSDIDLIVVVPSLEGLLIPDAIPVDDLFVLISRYNGRRVDIEIVGKPTFSETAVALAAHDADRARRISIPREFLTTLNSLRIGIPLQNADGFRALRDSFPWRSLQRTIADYADTEYQATSEDAIGAIRAGDAGTAMLSSRSALQFAVDAYIAASGHTNTRRKWRVRKLDALGETEVKGRYLDLELDRSGEDADLLARSRERIKYAQSLLLEVHTRNERP